MVDKEPKKIMVGPAWEFCLGEQIFVVLEEGGKVLEAIVIAPNDDESELTIELLDGTVVIDPNFDIVRTQIGDYL
jgi:hypothetical protein